MGGLAPVGQVLDKSKWEEDLGVIVIDDLKPSKQCLAASKRANSTLGYFFNNPRMFGPSCTESMS